MICLKYIFLIDIDECEEDTDSCDVKSMCTNTFGSYQCTCNIGFFGDGFQCSKYSTTAVSTVLQCTMSFCYHADCSDGDVLVYNGTELSNKTKEGTILVCLDNDYGLVCDDFWDTLDASVVCRQLGYSMEGQ